MGLADTLLLCPVCDFRLFLALVLFVYLSYLPEFRATTKVFGYSSSSLLLCSLSLGFCWCPSRCAASSSSLSCPRSLPFYFLDSFCFSSSLHSVCLPSFSLAFAVQECSSLLSAGRHLPCLLLLVSCLCLLSVSFFFLFSLAFFCSHSIRGLAASWAVSCNAPFSSLLAAAAWSSSSGL